LWDGDDQSLLACRELPSKSKETYPGKHKKAEKAEKIKKRREKARNGQSAANMFLRKPIRYDMSC